MPIRWTLLYFVYCRCCQDFLEEKANPVYMDGLETTGGQVEKEIQADLVIVDLQETGVI